MPRMAMILKLAPKSQGEKFAEDINIIKSSLCVMHTDQPGSLVRNLLIHMDSNSVTSHEKIDSILQNYKMFG